AANEKEQVIMTRIVEVENVRYLTFRNFLWGRSFLRCIFSACAGVFICALPLTLPSSAQPLAGSGPPADITPPPAQSNPLDKITPVTDALLVHVPEGDWLTWRRGYDATGSATGVQLWKTRLNDVPNSSPITYMVNGKQYIALTVGNGGAQATM